MRYIFNLSSSIFNNDIKYILILLNLFIVFDFLVIRVDIDISSISHLIIYYYYRSEIYILFIGKYTRLIRVIYIIVVILRRLIEIFRLLINVIIKIHIT